MSTQIQSEGTKALDQAEHNPDAGAKRVLMRAQDPNTGDFVNVGAADNGNGTFGISTAETTYATRIDDSSDPTIYIGKAPVASDTSSAVWQIAKLDTSSGLIKTWAGSAGFTQIWDNRAGLTYN